MRIGQLAGIILGGLFVATACGSEDVNVADLMSTSPEDAVTAPSVWGANEALEVVIHTSGNPCTSASRADVEKTSSGYSITPYNVVKSSSGNECPLTLVPIDHTVTLSFDAPGDYVIEVHGRGEVTNKAQLAVVKWPVTIQ